jgi:hypothetical protein
MLAEELRSAILYCTNLQIPLKEYVLNYTLRLAQLYDHGNLHQHLMLKRTTTNTNIIRTGLIVYTGDADEAGDKALACTEAKETVEEAYTEEGTHTVRDIKEIRETRDSNKRGAIFVTSQAVGQLSIQSRNVRRRTISSVNMLRIQQNKMLLCNITAVFLLSTKDLKESLILLIQSQMPISS